MRKRVRDHRDKESSESPHPVVLIYSRYSAPRSAYRWLALSLKECDMPRLSSNKEYDIRTSHTGNLKPDRRRRGHSNQFEIRHTNSDVYANSYFPKDCKDILNNLQQATNDQTSPLSFKNAVTKELFSKM